MWFEVSVAGRFALEALASGQGTVCAAFRRSFYLRGPGGAYVCVGDASLGCGPLNALSRNEIVVPEIGASVSVAIANAARWEPPPPPSAVPPDLAALMRAAAGRLPDEGLGCLILGGHNALAGHAQAALEAIDRWLVGNSLGNEAEALIGLGPGLTPSGDDYFGGVLVALHALRRRPQAEGLWRWLQPRLAQRTNAISAAHLTAAAAGQGHEALHEVLNGSVDLERLAAVGHCSGWDALAGALAVARTGA